MAAPWGPSRAGAGLCRAWPGGGSGGDVAAERGREATGRYVTLRARRGQPGGLSAPRTPFMQGFCSVRLRFFSTFCVHER